jgi:hypothetical protein
MAQGLADAPDATEASCVGIDRYGVVLRVIRPSAPPAEARIPFTDVARQPGDLRTATVDLTMRARTALGL